MSELTVDDIEWSAPPETRGRPDDPRLTQFIALLRTRPGEWAKLPWQRSSAFTKKWREARPDLEFRFRHTADKKVDTWMRAIEPEPTPKGKVFRCGDCPSEFEKLPHLLSHTLDTHKREPRSTERQPVRSAA